MVTRVSIRTALVGMAALAMLTGCGGGEQAAQDNGDGPLGATLDAVDAAKDVAAQAEERAEAINESAAGETPEAEPKYVTEHDPNAVYTTADLHTRGSYVKVNFGDLTPDQTNRVVHRLRTEVCTCGCPKDTIDECMINDPACGTAVELAKQVVREEKIKG